MKPEGDRTRVEVWAARGVCLWLCAWVPWRTRSLSCFPELSPHVLWKEKKNRRSMLSSELGRRSAVVLAAAAVSSPGLRPAPTPHWSARADEGFSEVRGPPGWALSIPSSFFRPKARPKAGTFDDTVFVAADYTTGHTTSVTSVSCAQFLLDSGDPLPLQAGQINSLTDLSLKPERLAKLLAGRRDNDPLGLQASRSEIKSAMRVGDSVSFEILTLNSVAQSMTAAAPAVRRTLGRTLFSRDPLTGEPLLVTAWASSATQGAVCEEVPCGTSAGGALAFQCPPPKCQVSDSASALDEAIVGSLRLLTPP